MSRTAFVTGFGVFQAIADNPSARLAEASGMPFRILEVAWAAVDEWLASSEAEPYEVLLHLGYADRRAMTPELVGRHRNGATPDVRGEAREGAIGPTALKSSLWDDRILQAVVDGETVRASGDAGGYLCNYILYRSLERYPGKRIGFMHVPNFDVIPFDRQLQIVKRVLTLATA